MYKQLFAVRSRLGLKIGLLIAIVLASACSTTLTTQITTFKDKAASTDTAGSVYIRPLAADKAGSLEFSYYAEPLADKLQMLGFQVVQDSKADFLVDLEYSVARRGADDKGNSTVILSSGFGGYRHGTSMGVVLGGNKDEDYEYERVVNIRLKKRTADNEAKNLSLVEVSAVSVGRCELLLPIYPAMLDAVFADFYRANGSTVRIKSSLDANHCKTPIAD
jgi:hypothetical protein